MSDATVEVTGPNGTVVIEVPGPPGPSGTGGGGGGLALPADLGALFAQFDQLSRTDTWDGSQWVAGEPSLALNSGVVTLDGDDTLMPGTLAPKLVTNGLYYVRLAAAVTTQGSLNMLTDVTMTNGVLLVLSAAAGPALNTSELVTAVGFAGDTLSVGLSSGTNLTAGDEVMLTLLVVRLLG